MDKKLILLNILLVIGVLLIACGTPATTHWPARNQSNGVEQISAHIQATDQPPIVITVPVLATNSQGGAPAQTGIPAILVYVLIGAVILIALVAILRKS